MKKVEEIYGIEKQAWGFLGGIGRGAFVGSRALLKGGVKGLGSDLKRGAGVFTKNIVNESKKGIMPALGMGIGGLTVVQAVPGARQVSQKFIPKGLRDFTDAYVGTGGYLKKSRDLVNKSNFGQQRSFRPMPPTR